MQGNTGSTSYGAMTPSMASLAQLRGCVNTQIDSDCCLIYNAVTTGQGAGTMNDQDKPRHDGDPHSDGDQARETIARLTAEVEGLRGRLAAEKYADDLREA